MTPTHKGSFRIFSFAGIAVFVHWSWFFVAIYSVQFRTQEYSSILWSVLEYLALFLIVLIHEFGHQLACRQVGGQTHDIVLWPLGGVAYVSPPQRPGAQLWSIAAGPLVNVVLMPVLGGLVWISAQMGWGNAFPDFYELLKVIFIINLGLLIFNMLPIYPLDGGQILRSLLWFVVGRANSLMIVAIIGFVGVLALAALALWLQSIWTGIIAIFMLLSCWRGLNQARALARVARLPRRAGYACPSCQMAPPLGAMWLCLSCSKPFDMCQNPGICSQCGASYAVTQCLDCGDSRPVSEWFGLKPPPL